MNNVLNVITWADTRGLLKIDNAPNQLGKVLEELGETTGAYLKRDGEEVIDGVGDVCVTLIILSKQLGLQHNFNAALKSSIPQYSSATTYLFEIAGEVKNISDRLISDQGEFGGFPIFEAVRNLRGFCDHIGHDLEFCLDRAYNEIKDRTGKKIDGVFVKD